MLLVIGCVEVVGCLKCEELVCWEAVPQSVGFMLNILLACLTFYLSVLDKFSLSFPPFFLTNHAASCR